MRNVLIIERDDFTSEILSDCLKTLNYIPFIYNPALSFKNNITTFKPMAIIFNLTLFQSNSYLPALEIKQHLTSKPSLILSSNILIDPDTLRSLNADFFLHKPYDIEILANVLNRAFEHTAKIAE
ncbi:MAG: hypothetical protein JWN56_1220 [Sphingobacteriales bacterium]|nr:hypothetical protein [Sphingobacteriales bacterium]